MLPRECDRDEEETHDPGAARIGDGSGLVDPRRTGRAVGVTALLTLVFKGELMDAWESGRPDAGSVKQPAIVPVAVVMLIVVALLAVVVLEFFRSRGTAGRGSRSPCTVVLMALGTCATLRIGPPALFVVLSVIGLVLAVRGPGRALAPRHLGVPARRPAPADCPPALTEPRDATLLTRCRPAGVRWSSCSNICSNTVRRGRPRPPPPPGRCHPRRGAR